MAKKKVECAMCERPIRGASQGVFPPHETARYCLRCHGRIWVIVEAQCRALRQSLVIRFTKELPHALGSVQKRVLGMLT